MEFEHCQKPNSVHLLQQKKKGELIARLLTHKPGNLGCKSSNFGVAHRQRDFYGVNVGAIVFY